MRALTLILCLISFSANALTISEQEVIIKSVIKSAIAKGYTDEETALAIRSNIFEVDEFMMCLYLPRLSECK